MTGREWQNQCWISGWGRSISHSERVERQFSSYWAPLYCATPSVVRDDALLANGKQWHAEYQRGTTGQENHPFRLATAAFHHWMRLKKPRRAGDPPE